MSKQTKQFLNKPKLEVLEACRAVAALLIVLFHATQLFNEKFNQNFLFGLFRFGSSGVDFFFVLSGFILFLSQSHNIGNNTQWQPFIFKRLTRIYPVYWLINFIVILIYFLIPTFGRGYERNLDVIIKSLLLIPQGNAPILVVAWFLSHIIFFYLLFTLLIALNSQFLTFILTTWLGMTVIFTAISIGGFTIFQDNIFVRFLFSHYNLEFVGGCAAAYFLKRRSISRKNALNIFYAGIVLFFTFGLLQNYSLINDNQHLTKYYGLFTYFIASLMIVIGGASINFDTQSKLKPLLLSVGAGSYVIYLIHYPVLSALVKVITLTRINDYFIQSIAMVIACVIAVLTGYIFHAYVERKLTSRLTKLFAASS